MTTTIKTTKSRLTDADIDALSRANAHEQDGMMIFAAELDAQERDGIAGTVGAVLRRADRSIFDDPVCIFARRINGALIGRVVFTTALLGDAIDHAVDFAARSGDAFRLGGFAGAVARALRLDREAALGLR